LEIIMRTATTMLFGFLVVVAAPIALANDTDTAGGAPTPAASDKIQTVPSSTGAKQQQESSGPVSADREQGSNHAQDRMSEEGRENTNAPNSPNRATGQDRANERHKQHDARDKPDNK
jgi:hypothetical protein